MLQKLLKSFILYYFGLREEIKIVQDFEEKVQKYLNKQEFVYKDKKDKILKKIYVLLDYLGQLHKNPEVQKILIFFY